jgi:hypothetical protein
MAPKIKKPIHSVEELANIVHESIIDTRWVALAISKASVQVGGGWGSERSRVSSRGCVKRSSVSSLILTLVVSFAEQLANIVYKSILDTRRITLAFSKTGVQVGGGWSSERSRISCWGSIERSIVSLTLVVSSAEQLANIVYKSILDTRRITLAFSKAGVQVGGCRSSERSWVSCWGSIERSIVSLTLVVSSAKQLADVVYKSILDT